MCLFYLVPTLAMNVFFNSIHTHAKYDHGRHVMIQIELPTQLRKWTGRLKNKFQTFIILCNSVAQRLSGTAGPSYAPYDMIEEL